MVSYLEFELDHKLSSSSLQETSPRICEVLFNQFLVGFLPVVLFWRRSMWILTIPYFRVKSLEADVCNPSHWFSNLITNPFLFDLFVNFGFLEFRRFFFNFSMTYIDVVHPIDFPSNYKPYFFFIFSWILGFLIFADFSSISAWLILEQGWFVHILLTYLCFSEPFFRGV